MLDAKRDPVTRPEACRRIGERRGINPEALRERVNQAETDAGKRPGTTTSDTRRLAELERENRDSAWDERSLEVGGRLFAAELDRPSTR